MTTYQQLKKKKLGLRTKVLLVSFIFFSSVLGYICLKPPAFYQASTTIRILGRQRIAGLLSEAVVYDPANQMSSQVYRITSSPVMSRVAEQLALINTTTSPEAARLIVKGLQERVTAAVVGSTNIIKVTVTAQSPQEAVRLANGIAQVYIEVDLAEQREQAQATKKFIETQLAQIELRLQKKERRGVDAHLVETFQRRVVELRFQLASLNGRYTAQHPRIRELEGQIATLEAGIQGQVEADFVYAQWVRETEADKHVYDLLKQKLEEVRIEEAEKLPAASVLDPAFIPSAPVPATGQLTSLMKDWKSRS